MSFSIVPGGTSGSMQSLGLKVPTFANANGVQVIDGKPFAVQYIHSYQEDQPDLIRVTDNPLNGGYVYDTNGNFLYWNAYKEVGGPADLLAHFVIGAAVVMGAGYLAAGAAAAGGTAAAAGGAAETGAATTSAVTSGTAVGTDLGAVGGTTAAANTGAEIGAANALSDASYAGADFSAVSAPSAASSTSLADIAGTARTISSGVSSVSAATKIFQGNKSAAPNGATGGAIFSRNAPAQIAAPKAASIGQSVQEGKEALPPVTAAGSGAKRLHSRNSYAPIAIAVLGTICAILLIERASRG